MVRLYKKVVMDDTVFGKNLRIWLHLILEGISRLIKLIVISCSKTRF